MGILYQLLILTGNIGRMKSSRAHLKYLERNLPQCHFIHHTSHMDCLGTVQSEADD